MSLFLFAHIFGWRVLNVASWLKFHMMSRLFINDYELILLDLLTCYPFRILYLQQLSRNNVDWTCLISIQLCCWSYIQNLILFLSMSGQYYLLVSYMSWLQVLNTLEEIQERHDAVREIEKKLLDLHQVFRYCNCCIGSHPKFSLILTTFYFLCQIYLDMAVLVEAQGDILDNIESQVCFWTF